MESNPRSQRPFSELRRNDPGMPASEEVIPCPIRLCHRNPHMKIVEDWENAHNRHAMPLHQTRVSLGYKFINISRSLRHMSSLMAGQGTNSVPWFLGSYGHIFVDSSAAISVRAVKAAGKWMAVA